MKVRITISTHAPAKGATPKKVKVIRRRRRKSPPGAGRPGP